MENGPMTSVFKNGSNQKNGPLTSGFCPIFGPLIPGTPGPLTSVLDMKIEASRIFSSRHILGRKFFSTGRKAYKLKNQFVV
jgi:hypothetical protein